MTKTLNLKGTMIKDGHEFGSDVILCGRGILMEPSGAESSILARRGLSFEASRRGTQGSRSRMTDLRIGTWIEISACRVQEHWDGIDDNLPAKFSFKQFLCKVSVYNQESR